MMIGLTGLKSDIFERNLWMNKSLGRIISLFMGSILLVGCTGNKIDNKIMSIHNKIVKEMNNIEKEFYIIQ